MIGTTRSRVSFFMNKFRKLGLIDYNGSIEIHSSLLNVVLRDQPQIRRWCGLPEFWRAPFVALDRVLIDAQILGLNSSITSTPYRAHEGSGSATGHVEHFAGPLKAVFPRSNAALSNDPAGAFGAEPAAHSGGEQIYDALPRHICQRSEFVQRQR
jgi:hypothetical protein